jgi:D-sedoheptulose 7-phosphate isomerase
MSSEKRPVDPPAHVRNHLLESAEIYRRVAGSCGSAIEAAATMVSDVFRSEGKMLICGNGGSAADAQHIAAELVSRLSKELDRPGLPAIALTTDTSFITAYGNDVDFAGIFERQVQALGRPGDVLVAISTSGNSPNVLRAVALARRMNLRTIALTGEGGRLAGEVECAITIPSRNTQYVQEALLSVEHIICELVELTLFT